MFMLTLYYTCCSGHFTIIFPLQTSGPASILDKDNTAKAVLEMAGRKQHSEGLREPEEVQ